MFKVKPCKVAQDQNHNLIPNDDFMWKDRRMDWTSGNLDYMAVTETHKAPEGDDVWWIWKYTWDVTPNNTRVEGPLLGNWTDRALLPWA